MSGSTEFATLANSGTSEPADCPSCGQRRQWNVDSEIVHARTGQYDCTVYAILIKGGDQLRYYQGTWYVVGYSMNSRTVSVLAFQGTETYEAMKHTIYRVT